MLYCDKLKKDKPLYCDNLEKDDMFEDKLFGLQDQLLKAAKDKDMICFIKVWVTMLKTSIQYFIYRLSNSSTFIIESTRVLCFRDR